jgi:alanine racemase
MEFDPAAPGQLLQGMEAADEPGIGPLQRGARMHPEFAGQVHHREQEIADFFGPPFRGGFRFDFRQLFPYLVGRASRVGPVEPHSGSALLEPEGHEQLGEGRGETVEQAPRLGGGALSPLEGLPALLGPQREQMGVPPLHLVFEQIGDLLRGELALLLGQDHLPGEVEQQVGDFGSNRGAIPGADRLVQLVDFLYQVGAQGFPGLDPVPGAAHSQIAHHGEGPIECRFRLHCSSRTGKLPAPVSNIMREPASRAWLEVDLGALRRNADRFAARAGAPLLPMVKANGYGLGAGAVTRALEPLSPWGYGVATPEEGAALREAGIGRPVVVFTPFCPGLVPPGALRQRALRPVIGDLDGLDGWLAGGGGPFHVEIDTGMSRAGFSWRDGAAIRGLGERLAGTPAWEGVFTHFHSPDTDPDSVTVQMDRFRAVLGALPRRPALVHFANSAAAGLPAAHGGDLARPGIFLYGGQAGPEAPEPVARLSARVVAVRRLEPGDTVSYGAEWSAPAASTIATLAIGYADGVLRSLGNRGAVELGGAIVPVVGRITMDLLLVNAGAARVRIGDVATLFGGRVSLDDQARRAGTNAYELLTAVSARVPRQYAGLPPGAA